MELNGYRKRALATLSGGEKQRVALAAVLAMGPRLVVLDEPSANLDPRATAELFVLLRELAADHRHTIVIIEHKLDEVIEWVDSVLVLDADGRLLGRGDRREVFHGRGGALAAAGVWRPQTVELVEGLRLAGWDVPGSPLAWMRSPPPWLDSQADGASGSSPRTCRRPGSQPVRRRRSSSRPETSPTAIRTTGRLEGPSPG